MGNAEKESLTSTIRRDLATATPDSWGTCEKTLSGRSILFFVIGIVLGALFALGIEHLI
jgi:hypothetical protein